MYRDKQEQSIFTCYGIKCNKLPSCITCKYYSFCKDAHCPSSSNYQSLDNLENLEKFAAPAILENESKTDIQKLAEIVHEAYSLLDGLGADTLFQAFNSMQSVYKLRPLALQISLKKILHPHMSYSEISKQLNLKSKQLVDYHLKQAIKVSPYIGKCLTIDKRYYPKNAKKRSTHQKVLLPLFMYQPLLFDDRPAL